MANVDPNSEEAIQAAQLTRATLSYFEKFDRYDCQELLAYASTHWMLSNEDFRLPTDPPVGLISNVNLLNSNDCVVLFPDNLDLLPIDYRELHTIVRELTYGIYVMHQTPLISLEANYDQSTSCQLPPAYQDTLVGQILVNTDYMMKCLWHGAYIPKDKRTKFSERWRSNLDVNQSGKPETKKPLLTEFTSAGLMDITKDPDFADAYSKLPVEQPGDPDMAEERRFFMAHVESLSMHLNFFQQSVTSHKNMFVVDSEFLVSSVVSLLDDAIDHTGYERLKTRLQMHEDLIRDNLVKKQEMKHNLELLKFISYMTPFFIGMKKRMKIPDVTRLLSPLTGDECRTERELPPLILGPDMKCRNFSFGEHYFHLHGGINFDLETDVLTDCNESFVQQYEHIRGDSIAYLHKILDTEAVVQEYYKVPSYEINGKRYLAVAMEFETYYGSSPHKPMWVRTFHDEMSKMKLKKLPITDIHLHEQFKKYFGFKKAIKYKTPVNGLKMAAQRGLVAIFQGLCRRMPGSRLGKQDDQGLSLLHHAAMHNRPQIIAMLLIQSIDVNVRRNNILSTGFQEEDPFGPTALHVAARCGALDAVECLLANYANILAVDQDGWTPVHHAAFFDHQSILKLMVRKNLGLLELTTKNELKSTPLLLAASSGGLSAVKCLISLSADIRRQDSQGNNMVTLAALRFHTNVLEFLIDWNNPGAPVWKVLVSMLNHKDMAKKDSAVKCLEVLSTCKPDHWRAILNAGGVLALVDLLKLDSEEIQSVAASVLCNISEYDKIRNALTDAQAGPILIQLLGSAVDDIQSRAAIILSDLACIAGNQEMIANSGGVEPLVNLLDSELEDVLVNAVNAIRVLCSGHNENQTAAAMSGALEPLVEFLTVASDDLQAGTAAAIAAVCSGHRENQDFVMAEGAARPLVDLIRGSRSTTVQVKAASALEALAQNNPTSQRIFLELDAPKALIRLLKNIYTEVREQGACSLWALAGHTKTQQKYIAERVTIPHIIQMLLEPTEKLLHVGCMTAIALGRENMENQNKLAEADAFQQLVRLLRTRKRNDSVLLMVIKVLGILCVGVAYRNNKVTQRRIAEEGGIPILVQILLNPPSEEVQVEVAISLGCVVLSNRENQEKLQEEPNFKFDILLDLLRSRNEEIRLHAGMALTIFAFNNTPQQFAIREAGGIKYSVFRPFVEAEDEFHQCYAAFQVVVLARVIVDQDQVTLTAKGITLLVDKLQSQDDKVLVLACSLLSSLSHTRAGIPDAMITSGAIDLLVNHLNSVNDQVRNAAAVSLGYLTFNKTAARILFSACRNTPGLFKKLTDNIGVDPRISQQFVKEFERAKMVGLPSQCLEINGGHPVQMPSRKSALSRPQTTQDGRRLSADRKARAMSAPSTRAASHRSNIPAIVVPDRDTKTPNLNNNNNPRSASSHRPLSSSSGLSSKLSSKPGSFKS
ncbi:ankyrin and armadillo repeat-containing protein-like isoform X4 [Littorina saxatilis]|uniref:ankyrin and armadillo repeat-containing protein-like isoform X4 n=1 Tax=Littorina saxatilis TaxID=31220 RepID=UPI0038B566C7